jgi:SAM-dependent methyltransferase
LEAADRIDLDKLYRLWKWLENPGHARARKRFLRLKEYFKALLSKAPFSNITSKKELSLIDIMAGTGIAGIAFAAAHTARVEGASYKLAVLDLRREALSKVEKWISWSGLKGVNVKTIQGDARRLPEQVEEKYDVAIVWGDSLSHLNVRDLILLLSGIREILAENGIVLIEQWDMIPSILFENKYRNMNLEGEALTLHKGYNEETGTVEREVYDSRTMLHQGTLKTRLWEVATVAGYAWLFFRRVARDHYPDFLGRVRLETVVIAWEPRKEAPKWKDLWEEAKTFNKEL